MAQEGLHVAPYLSDDFSGGPNVTIVKISGERLKDLGMRKYKSISESGDPDLGANLLRCVTKDGSTAVSKEVSYKKGQLYYGFYFLGGKNYRRKYLLYLNLRAVGKQKSTLIFIEGDLSENEVKDMINM